MVEVEAAVVGLAVLVEVAVRPRVTAHREVTMLREGS